MVLAANSTHLAKSAIFAGLPTAALEQLAAQMQRRVYKRRRMVFHQHDPGSALYLIEEGRVKIVLETEEGEEILLRVLGASEVFGELALLDAQPRSASVVTLEDTIVHVLEREAFLAFLRAQPEAVLHCLRSLAGLIRRLTEQVEDLAVLDVPHRLERKLVELADAYGQPGPQGVLIDLRLTQSELASMIGTSRVSVNQYLAALVDRGVISLDGQRIVLRRPDALRGPGAGP